MARRHELTDDQFAKLAPLLPPERPATGRPNHDHRRILNGILWRLKTGAPWRDVPARYGKWDTVYSRFRRWERAGVWARILAALQAAADARGELDWGLHFVDGTSSAPTSTRPGPKRGGQRRGRGGRPGPWPQPGRL